MRHDIAPSLLSLRRCLEVLRREAAELNQREVAEFIGAAMLAADDALERQAAPPRRHPHLRVVGRD